MNFQTENSFVSRTWFKPWYVVYYLPEKYIIYIVFRSDEKKVEISARFQFEKATGIYPFHSTYYPLEKYTINITFWSDRKSG